MAADLDVLNLADLDLDFEECDLTCQVCLEVPRSGFLLSCRNSHAICSGCKEALPDKVRCPTCREEGVWVRSKVLDKILDRWEFPCKYAKQGCSCRLARRQLNEHELTCCHVEKYPCVYLNCDQRMALRTMAEHVRRDHPAVKCYVGSGPHSCGFVDTTGDLFDCAQGSGHWFGALINFDGRHFFFNLSRVPGGNFRLYVYFVGKPEDAADSYAAVIAAESHLTLRYEGPVNCAETFGRDKLDEELMGLTLTRSVASKLSAPTKWMGQLRRRIVFSVALKKI